MKRKSRAFRPGANTLEPRALLSVADVAIVARTAPRGSGVFQGRYRGGLDNRAADAPLRVGIEGEGRVLGQVRMVGSLDFGGFRRLGVPDISGRLTLTNARGSVKIRLSGTGGFSEVAGQRFELTTTIVSGTGAYKNMKGVGVALASFGPDVDRGNSGEIEGRLRLHLDLRPKTD